MNSSEGACGACQAGNHDECFGGDCTCCGTPIVVPKPKR